MLVLLSGATSHRARLWQNLMDACIIHRQRTFQNPLQVVQMIIFQLAHTPPARLLLRPAFETGPNPPLDETRIIALLQTFVKPLCSPPCRGATDTLCWFALSIFCPRNKLGCANARTWLETSGEGLSVFATSLLCVKYNSNLLYASRVCVCVIFVCVPPVRVATCRGDL